MAPVDVAPPTVPPTVDRLIVHQMDVLRPVPGGIDGAIRGMLRFADPGDVVAVVGALTEDRPGRRPGRWERHEIDGRTVWFLPVARLDAGDQRRRLPHSVRLVAGTLRHRSRLPRARSLHAHRADVAWAAARILRGTPLTYFVHTQAGGLSTGVTDSFWGRAPWLHLRLERDAVRRAEHVVVFNPDYARELRRLNPRTEFSPSWFEPDLVPFTAEPTHPNRVVWVGRLEGPKDPALALDVLEQLVAGDGASPWELVVVGSGTLADELERARQDLAPVARSRVRLAGRLDPAAVGEVLGSSGVFLMTSHAGYEGHPRVLVEALASGLPSVVTEGSDTGGLVVPGVNGYVCSRDPAELADAVRRAVRLSRAAARSSTEELSAPVVVSRILRGPDDRTH